MFSAVSRDDSEYNLHLAFDINTDRHTQWFYFSVTNLRKRRPYKLNMQNLMKSEAVYNLGMQPLAYSEVWLLGTAQVVMHPAAMVKNDVFAVLLA